MKKILLLGIIFYSYAFTQQKMQLKVEECIEIGLKNNKSLHSSALNIEAANARYNYASASKLPQLKLFGAYARLSPITPFSIQFAGNNIEISPSILDNYQTKVSLTQPIFIGFTLTNTANLNENLFLASQNDYVKDKSELKYKIQEAYWNLFRAKEFKKVIDENVLQMQAHLKDIKNFYDQGIATNSQILQVQVQLSNARLNQIDANNNVRLSNINLNNILELPLETEIDITSQIDKKDYPLSELKILQEKAFNTRPELKSMEYKVKASEFGVDLSNALWYPQIFLNANYNYNRPNQRIFPSKDEFKGTWDVSLSLQWDIWTWGKNNDKVAEAKASLSQAQDGLNIMKNGVAMDVTSNYLSLIKTKESIVVADDGVKQAEENYKVTNDKFKSGMALNTDMLDAEVALLQARLNYTQTLVNFELAIAKIQKSIGE